VVLKYLSPIFFSFLFNSIIPSLSEDAVVNSKKDLKHLVIDCLRIKKSPVHFNLDEALYVHSCLKPKKTILTNLNSDLNYLFLLKKLPNNVLPAYDG